MANPVFPNQLPANDQSRADYYREGKRRLLRAVRRFPELPPLEALVRFVEFEQHRLSKSSARRYRYDHARIASVLCRRYGLPRAAYDVAMERISLALDAVAENRKRQKVTDTTRDEVIVMFDELKSLGLSGRRGWKTAAIASFYVFIVPSIGIRPIELLGAQVLGATLYIQTAKRQSGDPNWRPIALPSWPQAHLDVLEMLILMAPQNGNATSMQGGRVTLLKPWRGLANAPTYVGFRLTAYAMQRLPSGNPQDLLQKR